MNNRYDFASLIKCDWRQRSTAKASFARNAQSMGLLPTNFGDSGALTIQTQDLCSDFIGFQMMQHSISIFNCLSAEDKLNLLKVER